MRPTVVKFGGELIEDPTRLDVVVSVIARAVSLGTCLVAVHGGGKEIDAALETVDIEKRQVDGLRITDEATLKVVVAVLAGAVNTRFVAALVTAGVPAVGLTGADAACGLSDVAPPHRTLDGRIVDLGLVGVPSAEADPRLIATLLADRFVPVIACIGLSQNGRLLNVNADTFAGHLAARLNAERLVIAGTTPGVLDERGSTLTALGPPDIGRLLASRTASAGMIAKLRACEHAVAHGVGRVVIVDGGDHVGLEAAVLGEPPATATQVVAAAAETRSAV